MANTLIKPSQTEKNLMNHNPNTLKEYSIFKKSRQQIYQENYQKNKEKKKQQQKERYYRKKEQAQQTKNEQSAKYYQAEAIQILMSLKEYTELNSEKKHLWLDFNWTLKDCREAFQKGFGNVVAVMKLEQVAGKLVRDYWTTAKSELEQKTRNWNNLDYDEQQRLIRYWGYEKTRVENGYIEEWERLEKQSREHLKEIERAKFHEERGRINCPCGWCEQEAIIKSKVKTKMKKKSEKYNRESGIKEKCPECGKWFKELDEENGICRSCMKRYE